MISAIILAACLSHDPLDMRCKPIDFVQPGPGYYLYNPAERQSMLALCYSPNVYRRPPAAWCAAAAQAQRTVSGGNWGHY